LTLTSTLISTLTQGWTALQTGTRAAKELLEYTLPISAPEGYVPIRVGKGEDGYWRPFAKAEALWEGEWCPVVVERRNWDGSYSILWDGIHDLMDREYTGPLRPRDATERDASDSEERSESPPKAESDGEMLPNSSVTLNPISSRGFENFEDGFPFEWDCVDFVNKMHEEYSQRIKDELEPFRAAWATAGESNESPRCGSKAAEALTTSLKSLGIAVYAGPESHSEDAPYGVTGPRFYVSLTQAFLKRCSMAERIPEKLEEILWSGRHFELDNVKRLRGLGWTLAPGGSDPQQLHSDIWGGPDHPKRGRLRFPHLFWKAKGQGESCTTEVLPGGFTEGSHETSEHFKRLVRSKGKAVIMDSEVLHRGAAGRPGDSSKNWVSTCSIEICSPSGWEAWKNYGTAGTVPDDVDSEEWTMIECEQSHDARRRRRSNSLPGIDTKRAKTTK